MAAAAGLRGRARVVSECNYVEMKVRRSARRVAVGRMAAVVTAVLVAGAAAAGCGLVPDGSPVSTASARPGPSAPFLAVELTLDQAVEAALAPTQDWEGILVVVQVSIHGFVPQLIRDGSQATGQDNLQGLKLSWGDPTNQSFTPGEHTCVADAPLVEVDTEFVVQHVYTLPGSYTVTYETAACEPVGSVTRTLELTVG